MWPIIFTRRDNAIRELKLGFIEGEDFISVKSQNIDNQHLLKNEERRNKGQFSGENRIDYFLSVPCLEFFIAKRVRAVFEVYRKIFHRTVEKEISLGSRRKNKNGQEYIDLTDIPYECREINNRPVRVITFEDVDWYSMNDILSAIGSRTSSNQVARRFNSRECNFTLKILIHGNTHPAWFTSITGVKLMISGSRKMGGNPQQLQITIGGLV